MRKMLKYMELHKAFGQTEGIKGAWEHGIWFREKIRVKAIRYRSALSSIYNDMCAF